MSSVKSPRAWIVAVALGVGVVLLAKFPGLLPESPRKPDPGRADSDADREPLPPPVATNHGTGFNAAEFYHLDQGSGIYPFAWARALIDIDTGQPFLSHPERFGLLPDPVSEFNPHGLPVGLTVGRPQGLEVEMLGLTCAACHTSQLRFAGRSIRVDGSASQFSTDQFLNSLIRSSETTIASPDRLWAFLVRLEQQLGGERPIATGLPDVANPQAGGIPLDEDTRRLLSQFDSLDRLAGGDGFSQSLAEHVTARVQSVAEELEGFVEMSRNALDEAAETLFGLQLESDNPLADWSDERRQQAITSTLSAIEDSLRLLKARVEYLQAMPQLGRDALPAGYGREDDFGVVRNALFGEANRRPARAPVSIPPMWSIERMAWLHWTASTTSLLDRNLGEAIGVGAAYDPETGFTSIHLRNQMRLVELADLIRPPTWPAELFGAPNAAKVERGRNIYGQRCARCHDGGDVNSDGFLESKLFSPEEIGTDPAAALVMQLPIVDQARAESVGFTAAIAQRLETIKARAFADMSAVDRARFDQLEQRRGPVKWRGSEPGSLPPSAYPAKRLEGVWATPPYLHNGSVPTLHHLLLPARERPATFAVGQEDYDPVQVGIELDASRITPVRHRAPFTLDTSIPGNLNTGHEGEEFGTTLNDTDRAALIEYLKVHRNP